jgi:hypothetical protein
MTSISLSRLPAITLALICFYGAFSRLTHGVYTPQFYAYQSYRLPDDGSPAAAITPVMDIAIGTMLLLPRRRIRVGAAVSFLVLQSIGLGMQVQAGKDWTGDAVMIVLGLLAAVC